MLDDLGLIAALEWYCQEFQSRTNIPCHFKSDVESLNIERNLATNIFRVYQETLTNVARHSGASAVEAKLSTENDVIRLTIQDDGSGFDIDEVRVKKSLGLIGMRERAILFGGDLLIKSRVGEGTIVTLEIPMIPVDNKVI
jgi:signal transduction histidine kinase